MTPFPFFFVSSFFLFRPTDPKSENAFDNKRKKKGWPCKQKMRCSYNVIIRVKVVLKRTVVGE